MNERPENVNKIFKIEVITGAVFMRVDRTNYCNEERAIVIVNATLFLSAWRRNAGPVWQGVIHSIFDPILRRLDPNIPARDRWLPYLSHQTWTRDYKFHHAEKGFSIGLSNPVPLAIIGNFNNINNSISFTNGITRTIWLLVHGVKEFPVECHISIADALSRALGVGIPPISVYKLLDQKT